MATVIDSLVVTLGLDNKDFQQGVKDTEKGLDDTRKRTDRVGKDIAASGKDAAEFFGQMQRSAIKFFAVLTAGRGLLNFTRDVVSTGANLSRMSKNLGESADTMHRWGKAAELNGGSMEGFLGTLQNLNSQMTEIQMTGKSAMTPFFSQIGVDVRDASGKMKSGTQLLMDIATQAENRISTRQARYSFLTAMGLDESMATMLSQGAKATKEMVNAQQGFSQADADRAAKADRMWKATQSRLEALTRELVIKALPALEKLAENFLKLAEVAIPPLSKAVEIFVDLDKTTDGWSTNLLLALGTLRLITGGSIVGGLAAVSGTLATMAASAAALAAPLGFLFYSEGLNKGEDEALKEMQGPNYMGPTAANKKGASVAERHNNPGNLIFAGQKGATKGETIAGHTFARFETQQAGIQALHRQLQLYQKRGIDTVGEIMEIYAPRATNPTDAYIKALSKSTGFDPNQPLNFGDPATAAAMIQGLSKYEAGHAYLKRDEILSGINAGSAGGMGGSSTTSIGQFNVYTNANDPKGIINAGKGEWVRQFDNGLQ